MPAASDGAARAPATRVRRLELPPVPALALDHLVTNGTVHWRRATTHGEVWYDTAELDLRRWGLELVRDRDRGWILVLPEAPGVAGTTLVRGPGQLVPRELARLVRVATRGAPLGAIVELDRLVAPFGIEVADHAEGSAATVLEGALEQRRVAAAGELRGVTTQLHLRRGPSGRRRELDRAVRAVVTLGGREVAGGPEALAGAVLGPRATAPPWAPEVPQVGADARVVDLVTWVLADGLDRMVRSFPHARLGVDPEGVHQLRVATRRLRANLRTWRGELRPGPTAELRAELGWLADVLGAVRDDDVRGARLRSALEELGPLPGGAELLRVDADHTLVARIALDEALDGPRLDGLLAALEAAVLRPPVRRRSGRRPARAVLPGVVAASWDRLAAEVDALGDDPPDAALHVVRLRAKRLRYAAEAAVVVVGDPARRTARRAAKLQEVLGEHQDAVIADAWLVALGGRAPKLQPAVTALRTLEQQRAAAARSDWPAAWRRLDRPSSRRWFRPG